MTGAMSLCIAKVWGNGDTEPCGSDDIYRSSLCYAHWREAHNTAQVRISTAKRELIEAREALLRLETPDWALPK